MNPKTTIFICTSCGLKDKDIGIKSKGRGEFLLKKVQQALHENNDINVEPVSCLSNCNRGISVAISAHNKYHWVFGEKSEMDQCVDDIINSAKAHYHQKDGFLEKPDRAMPVIARIPPITK